MIMPGRILILMSDTGGGHRASAQALKAGFDELFPNRYQIDIIDLITDYLPWPVNQVPKAYPFVSNRTPWLWKGFYDSDNSLNIGVWLADTASRISVNAVCDAFQQFAPDLIISVHPLFQVVGMWAMERLAWDIPFVTVVTDLSTAHPLWFHPKVTACFVASDFTYELALKAGIPSEHLHLYGLPIRPAFARPSSPRPVLRTQLSMDINLPAVLLVGGGEGVGPVEEIAHQTALALSQDGGARGQIVIVCGRNRALSERLRARDWPVPTIINGFVENMPDWMAACDCVVTKAGPGTIAEALISGLPLILSGFIPGQEEGNVPYVVDNGVGAYSTDPKEIAATVAQWFGPERARLEAMAVNARALGHPRATFDIVRSIDALMMPTKTGYSSSMQESE